MNSLVDRIDHPIFVVSENGNIEFVNASAEKMIRNRYATK